MDYLPDGTVDTETAMEMLSESWKQIERMDHFVETMRKMSSLEQRTLLSRPITAKELEDDIKAELVVLEAEKEKAGCSGTERNRGCLFGRQGSDP